MFMDAELSLGTTDLDPIVNNGQAIAYEGAAVSAVDMGSSPFGATDLILLARMVEENLAGATGVMISLVSRDTTPTATVNEWTLHTSVPLRAAADLLINDWFQPIRVPANAGRYLSVLFSMAGDCTAGKVQAFFLREIDLPLASPQLFPTP